MLLLKMHSGYDMIIQRKTGAQKYGNDGGLHMKRLKISVIGLLLLIANLFHSVDSVFAQEKSHYTVNDRTAIYTQWDNHWHEKVYNSGGKIYNDQGNLVGHSLATGGCGVFAMAHVAQFLRMEPVDTNGSLPTSFSKKYQYSYVYGSPWLTNFCSDYALNVNWDRYPGALADVLNAGGASIMSMYGHLVAAVELSADGQKVRIIDSCAYLPQSHGITCYSYNESTQVFSKIGDWNKVAGKVDAFYNDDLSGIFTSYEGSPYGGAEYWIDYDTAEGFGHNYIYKTANTPYIEPGPSELVAISAGNGKAELSTDDENWVTSLTVEAGTNVLVRATADSGYSFSHWTTSNGSDSSFKQSTAYQTVFTMPSGNTTVTAHFKKLGAGITVSPTSLSFGTVSAGYTAPAAQKVTISNTGTTTQTLINQSHVNYNITYSKTTLAPGEQTTATIQPRTGLGAGDYSTTLSIDTSDICALIPVSFVVKAPVTTEWYNLSANNKSSAQNKVTDTDHDVYLEGYVKYEPNTLLTSAGCFLSTTKSDVEKAEPNAIGNALHVSDPASSFVTPGTGYSDADGYRYTKVYYSAKGTGNNGFGTELEAGETYYYKFYSIRTVNGVQEYKPSEVMSFKTTGTSVTPVYSITASPASLSFGSQTAGYTAPAAQTVTITNTGNQTVTLTQPIASSYTIGALSTTSLAPNGTATFTVAPKAGLSAGTYNESIVINTNSTASANVSTSFTVAEAVYSIAVSPNVLDFGTITEGEQPVGKTVTITNTGNQTVTLNTQSQPAHYTLSNYSKTMLQPGETATVVVTPNSGLTAGSYDDSFWITTDVMSASAQLNAKLTVKEKPTYSLAAASAGNGKAELSADGVSWSANLNAKAGTRVLVRATADSGYEFSHWTVSGGSDNAFDQTDAFATGFTMPSSNATVTAHFVMIEVTPTPTIEITPTPTPTPTPEVTPTPTPEVTPTPTPEVTPTPTPEVTPTPTPEVTPTPTPEVTPTPTPEVTPTPTPEVTPTPTPSIGMVPAIQTSELPTAALGQEYKFQLLAKGEEPIRWTIVAGHLPDGFTLSPDGVISGVPTKEGAFVFTVCATGRNGASAMQQMYLLVEIPTAAPVPQTGDHTPLAALLILTLCGLTGMLTIGRKQRATK